MHDGFPAETFTVRAGIFSSKRIQTFAAVLLPACASFLVHTLRTLDSPLQAIALAGGYALALASVFWPTSITVGADGILVRGFLRRSFHPIGRIRTIRKTPWGIGLLRDDWREVEIRTEAKANEGNSLVRERLLASIERRHKGLVEAAPLAVLLARGGRPAEEWARQLAALGAQDGSAYRSAAPPHEELWKVLEDPTCHAEVRAGAAAALCASMGEAERARVRVAIEQVASPKLRVALSAVSEGARWDELVRALDECCQEDGAEPYGRQGASRAVLRGRPAGDHDVRRPR